MASQPSGPLDPKRDSSSKIDLSRTPHPKSGSFGDTDWLNEIPEPPAIPEGSGSFPAFVDSDFDIQTLFPGTAAGELAADSELVDLGAKPDADPLSPASGWFDSGVLKTPPPLRPKTPAPAPSDGGSDIFSDGRRRPVGDSEVLASSLPYPSPSSSNIFDAPAEGSSKFANPTDGTEEVGDLNDSNSEREANGEDDLFLAFDQPPSELFNKDADGNHSLSGLMDDGANAVNSLLDQLNLNFPTPTGKKPVRPAPPSDDVDSRPDFNIVGKGSSGSNLFRDDETSHFLGDLAGEKADGPDSTIFQHGGKEPSSINLDQIPLMSSSDDHGAVDYTGEDVDGSESIFQTGSARAESGIPYPEDSAVDFNIPKRKTKIVSLPTGAKGEDDGEIDWTMPSNSEQSSLSAHRSVVSKDSADHFDAFALDESPEDEQTRRLSEPVSGIYSVGDSPSKIFPRPSVSVNSSGSRTSLGATRSGDAPAPKMGGSGIFEMRSAHTLEMDGDAAPAKSGKLGWLFGSAAGLLVGVGLSGGAYFAFADKPETSLKIAPPTGQTATSAPEKFDVSDARKFLAVGDAARALPALEAAGDSAGSVVIAERGKARWLVRVRELAAQKQAATVDDPLLKQALADLEQIVANAENLKTPEEKQVAVEAALRVGLTKELTGDAAGASAYYALCAKRFPTSKIVFDTAVRRVKAMPAPAGNKVALLPQQADELANLVLPALLLIQAEVAAGDPEAEAGFLFWEAINEASVNNFAKARNLILKARAAHDARRLTLAGRGLNPLSDPMEQMFLRCCNDLNAFWVVKESLYTHPTAGPIFAKAGLNKITAAIDELAGGKADPKIAEELTAAKAKLVEVEKAGEAKRKELADNLAAAELKAKEATAATETAKKEVAALKTAIERSQELLVERTKAATEAKDAAELAKKNLTTATAGLDKVVLALKSAKLVDADADTAGVLKNLPEVMKKLATAADSTDAKKAAEALAAAKKEVDAANAAMKEKEALAATAKEQLEQAKAELTTKLAAAKTESEKALAAAKLEAAKMLELTKAEAAKTLEAAKAESTELRASIAAEVKKGIVAAEAAAAKKVADLEAAQLAQTAELKRELELSAKRMAVREEEHRRQLADARAGAVVPLTGAETFAREKAAALFGKAVEAYFAGRQFEAEPLLERIVELNPADARHWYFLGLTRFAQGKPTAEDAFKKGAEQENRNLPSTREINASLERVQGAARAALKPYRP